LWILLCLLYKFEKKKGMGDWRKKNEREVLPRLNLALSFASRILLSNSSSTFG
jgi:hypothetical protein